jgi:hypothetical protein
MSTAKVNQLLSLSGTQWHQFEIAACANSASDLIEARRLQDALTVMRNQLSVLDAALQEQIRELSNPH